MTRSRRTQLQATTWLAVVRAYQACNRHYARMLQCLDLTIPQFDVLDAVHRLGHDATPRAIADELVVTRGNVSGILRRLQEHGWLVTRDHEQDGRSFVCRLTRAGRTVHRRARSAAAQFVAQQLSVFDETALRETAQRMDIMREHLEAIDPEGIAATATGGASAATVSL